MIRTRTLRTTGPMPRTTRRVLGLTTVLGYLALVAAWALIDSF